MSQTVKKEIPYTRRPLPEDPLVSIIMPAYRQADYIADAIRSVEAQTYTNWQLVIVDDGSPDNVSEVVAPFVAGNPRIRFFHTPNGGVSAARNFGVAQSSGELILPLDADDIIDPDYLRLAVERFRTHPGTDVVYCRWKFFGETSYTPKLEYSGYRDLLHHSSIFNAGIYRREAFDAVGGYDEDFRYGLEDWELWIRMLADDSVVYQIPKPLFHYRIKPVSRNSGLADRETHADCLNRIYYKHRELYESRFGSPLSYIGSVNKWENKSLFGRIWYALKGHL